MEQRWKDPSILRDRKTIKSGEDKKRVFHFPFSRPFFPIITYLNIYRQRSWSYFKKKTFLISRPNTVQFLFQTHTDEFLRWDIKMHDVSEFVCDEVK